MIPPTEDVLTHIVYPCQAVCGVGGEPGMRSRQTSVVTVDLTNCFPSMRVLESVSGAFTVQGLHSNRATPCHFQP